MKQSTHWSDDIKPVLLKMEEVEHTPINWLWQDRLPVGHLVGLVGQGGVGKSFLMADIAARLSRGASWPDGSGRAPTSRTVLVAGEDDPGDVLKPRLQQLKADLGKVRVLKGRQDPEDEDDVIGLSLDCPHSVVTLRKAIEQANAEEDGVPVRLLVIDPIGELLGKAKSNDEADVRRVLEPLVRLARDFQLCCVWVGHTNKSSLGGSALTRVMGASAFTNKSRILSMVGRSPDDEGTTLWTTAKANICRSGASTTLAFRVQPKPARLTWVDGTHAYSADDIVRAGSSADGDEEKSGTDEAVEFLVKTLGTQSVASGLVHRAANDEGISRHHLFKAKRKLGVQVTRSGFQTKAAWRLPDVAQTDEHTQPAAPALNGAASSSGGNDEQTTGRLEFTDG